VDGPEPDRAAEAGPALRKELSTFSLTALIMGAMIGSGIFFLPGSMLRDAGGVWPVMLAWVGGASVALAGGLVFAELGAAFPKAGGQYAFLRDSLGRGWGFLFAWSGFAVVQSGTIAAVAVAMANAVDYLVGLPGSTPCLGPVDAGGDCGGLQLPKWGTGFLAVGIIWLLTAVNFLGVRRGAAVNNVATVAKTAALVAIAVLAFALGRDGGNFSGPRAGFGDTTFGGFGLALAASLFAYDGFSQATFVAAEAKDARRALPRAIVLATALVAAIYIAATFAYYHVLPVEEMSVEALRGDFPIASEAMGEVLGRAAASLVAAAIVVSTFGTVNTYVLTSPRIYHPIARDGGFPHAFGVLSRHGTPTYGLWYGAIWACFLTLTGSYARLADLVVFGLYVFYLATMVGYFVLRRKEPEAFGSAGFRMPLRPLPAVFFGVASVAVLGFYLNQDLRLLGDGQVGAFLASTTGMGAILIGLGLVLYAIRHLRQGTDPEGPRAA
jgi:APA family basic amino acid/polyamine antiporter